MIAPARTLEFHYSLLLVALLLSTFLIARSVMRVNVTGRNRAREVYDM